MENYEREMGVAPQTLLRVIDPDDIRIMKTAEMYESWGKKCRDRNLKKKARKKEK